MGEARATDSHAPLAGRTIVVTRARAQAESLIEPLEDLGADVIALPVIETVEPEDWAPADAAIDALSSYDWVLLSSTNAVERFVARATERGLDIDELRDGRYAVVGTSTGERLRELGIEPDLVPEEFRAEGLAVAFRAEGAGPGMRVLIPRALKGRDVLPEALREMGATVDVVAVYRTVPATPDAGEVDRLTAAEGLIVTFTSPSTVHNFASVLENAGLNAEEFLATATTASIGPVTTKALAEHGLEADVEAEESTAAGLLEVILEHAGGTAGTR
jgi:uroporphyrinogen III methyltransferase/synthase